MAESPYPDSDKVAKIVSLLQRHQDKLLSESELKDLVALLGNESPSLPPPQTSIRAVSVPPKSYFRDIVASVVVVLLVSIFISNMMPSQQQKAAARATIQKAVDDAQKIQDDLAKQQDLACLNLSSLTIAWDDFSKLLNSNVNTDQSSLLENQQWMLVVDNALWYFYQSIVASPSAAVGEQEVLLASAKELSGALAYLASAVSLDEFNQYVVPADTLFKRFQDAHTEFNGALSKICHPSA